jgi:DNA (cytosine-5)-methyltransferase 1
MQQTTASHKNVSVSSLLASAMILKLSGRSLNRHSYDALVYDQWVTGDYWKRHGLEMPTVPSQMVNRIAKLRKNPPDTLPWKTVRDAIADLPDPETKAAKMIRNHAFQAGARTYPGHTGSPLDLPAKTLKAGAHGVPGGENMLVRDDGSVRY